MQQSNLVEIPGIKLEAGEPVFSEPWEAQAFALVIELHAKGAFTWTEWADTLGEKIRMDDGKTAYYRLWLDALEAIVSQKSLITDEEVCRRKSDWQSALLATPHGEPVELVNGKS
ncbi:MAG: nitrile hydratase accessory protein [Pseudomonadota bacterium]